MHDVHPLHRLAVPLSGSEPIGDMYLTDNEDTVLLSDLTTNLSNQFALACTNPARLQRAPEGPR